MLDVSMPDRDLQIGFWVLRFKPILRRTILGTLFAMDAVVLIFFALQLVIYFRANADYTTLISGLGNNTVKFADVTSRWPRPELAVDQAVALADTGGEFQLVAIVRNPSAQWMVTAGTAHYRVGDVQVGSSAAVTMLPGETRYLIIFHVKNQPLTSGEHLAVQFTDLAWRRVTPNHPAPDVSFVIENPGYRVLSNTPSHPLSQVTGVLVNHTVKSFQMVTVTTLLMKNGVIVAAGQLQLDNIESLERRSVDIRFYAAPAITNVLLQPTVDLTALTTY